MAAINAKIMKICTANEPSYMLVRCCLIIILGVAAYGNTFGMSFNFDDAANILSNNIVREFNFTGIKQAFHTRRGLGIVSFQLNYYLSGPDVFGYHLFNLVIHLITALLVYRLLVLLTKAPCFNADGNNRLKLLPVPFLAALLFVAHPIQTQAVTYIVQRFTSMATMFYLAAVISYLQARSLQFKNKQLLPARSLAWFTVCLICMACAINTKEIAYTLPCAIVLAEVICYGMNWKKAAVSAALAISALAAVLVKLGLGKGSFEQAMFAMDEATRLQTITSRSDYLFTQFRVILTYIRLLLLPVNQSVDYDYTLSHSFFDPAVLGSFALLSLLIVVAVVLLKRSGTGDPGPRLIAFGIFWFFLTLSIESSVLPIIDLIFEHRVYLPSVGAITALTTAVCNTALKTDPERRKKTLCIVFLLIAVLLAGVTWKRNLVWKTEVTLWEDATAKKPDSSRAWNNLGGAYIKERSADKALKALVRAIELDRNKQEAWNNLGIAIDLKGVYRDRFNRTTKMFTTPESITDEILNKWQGEVNNNLGLAYEILGNYPKAVENYRNAVGYNPALGLAYYNLGLVSAAMGDYGSYQEQQQVLWLLDPALAGKLQSRVAGR